MGDLAQIQVLVTHLWQRIRRRFKSESSQSTWSNTQRLLLLWTLYECDQRGYVESQCRLQLLKWIESLWAFGGLIAVFDVSLDSFTDFTNEIYRHNLMSLIHDTKDEESEDETIGMGGDGLNDAEDVVMGDIDAMKDEDLFTV